jgi:integrase
VLKVTHTGTVVFNMARPLPLGFEVRESKPFNGKKWRVIGYVNGERKQCWFSTEKEAKANAADRNGEMKAYGTRVNLDSEARLEAFRGAERLRPHGKTVTHAVDFLLAHLERQSASVPFSTLAAQVRQEFGRRVKANEVSDRHAESLRETLKKLEGRFGEKLVSEITPKDIDTWLKGLPLAAKTRNKHRGYAGQVFNLAVKPFGYTKTNPLAGIKKFKERSNEASGERSVLTAAETQRLFQAADHEVIPYLTLSYFCGIRRATLEKLDWSNVKFDEKRAIVPRFKAKNGKRYRVTLSENAIEWLRPHVRASGSLLAISRATNTRGKASKDRTHRLIAEAATKAGVFIPDNGGRHTFISMHVAHHESIDKTALESDNSANVIKRDYLDIVTREDAARFWAIRPGA